MEKPIILGMIYELRDLLQRCTISAIYLYE